MSNVEERIANGFATYAERVAYPSSAQPSAGMSSNRMAALRLAMPPAKRRRVDVRPSLFAIRHSSLLSS